VTAEEKRPAFPVRLVLFPERQVAYMLVTNAFDTDRSTFDLDGCFPIKALAHTGR